MIYLIALAIVIISLATVLVFGAHARLRSQASPNCTPTCDYPAEDCCRRCLLHEACGIRSNARTGEVACRLA